MTCTHSRRLISAGILALCSVSLTGCGGGSAGPEGTTVISASGKIEYDGQPVPAGTVSFLHVETGNVAVCQIDDGFYESNSGEGPNPGNNLVTVEARDSEEGDPTWTWKKNVTVGETDFTEDFAVTSSEAQPFDPASRPVDDN